MLARIIPLIFGFAISVISIADDSPTQNCDAVIDVNKLYSIDSLLDSNKLDLAENKVITKILVFSLDVFDTQNPKENYLLYKALNKLHINTRRRVIKNLLLFKEGDKVDAREIFETERILRSQSYLTDAYILPIKICNGHTELAVVTRDAWALKIKGGIRFSGGETKSGFGFESGNFFGSGTSLAFQRQFTDDRNSNEYFFKSTQFANTRLNTEAFFSNNSDGFEKKYVIQRPFYSLDTKWSAGVKIDSIEEEEFNPELNDFKREFSDRSVFGGLLLAHKNDISHRIIFGVSETKRAFEQINIENPREDASQRTYPWIGFEIAEDKFSRLRNINQIQRTEDVLLGKFARAKIGFGPNEFNNNDQDFFRFRLDYRDGISSGKHHITQFELFSEGHYLFEDDSFENVFISTNVEHHHYLSDFRRWFARFRYDRGIRLTAENTFTFLEGESIRGYPFEEQFGNNRLILNWELRRFYDTHIFNFIRVGHVIFFDLGKAWNTGEFTETETLAGAGLGLRFSSSKAQVGNVVHVDLGFPLINRDNIDSVQLTAKSIARF